MNFFKKTISNKLYFYTFINNLVLVYSIYLVNMFIEKPWLSDYSIYIFSNIITKNPILLSYNKINILFIVLVSIVYNIIYIIVDDKNKINILFFLYSFLLLIFLVNNVFLFLVFYEIIVIILLYYIGNYGVRSKKSIVNLYLLIYSIIGSIFLILSIICMLYFFIDLNMEILKFSSSNVKFYFVLLFFILSFISKIPVFPFYFWLPEAHVESSIECSIILASLFLKLDFMV